ncbi:NUDIX domain-containing protein [Pseudoalteromonas distincta]|uniref:NUDIX domain-containing protein n=1 Tax=Pseudoalteromonas distincta TaxID=77608 RepID=UPI00243202AF|nr:NUDIX domain-containing protein [Pseudoalteromonas distincta]|tara:strand:- start:1659 stop:2096 length:438 start_codon:yes stop_codon:yes gene_type:complete
MHKPHVTVAAIVKKQNEFLLVKERDKFTKQICYNQPAGHLEQNETLAQAASRELLEETGLALAPIGFLGVYNLHADNAVHYLRFCFLFEAPNNIKAPTPMDSDIISASWHTLEQIKSLPLRSPLVLKCINDSLNRPPLSLETIYN